MLRKLVITVFAVTALATSFGGIMLTDDAQAGIMITDRSGVALGDGIVLGD